MSAAASGTQVSASGDAPETAAAVLAFWRAAGPRRWFRKDPAFDATFREQFYALHFAAARGELHSWLQHADSALAVVLLLDQFPRNAFRGTGHMFATDGLALRYAQQALPQLDQMDADMRQFIGLPFMHAEDRAVQQTSVTLHTQHWPDSLRWAVEHRDIIEAFGRFPHRNAALGRQTTPAEQQFLDAGGFAG